MSGPPWTIHMQSIEDFADIPIEEHEFRERANNSLAADVDQMTRDFIDGCGIGELIISDGNSAYIALTVSEIFERAINFMHTTLEKNAQANKLPLEYQKTVHELSEQYAMVGQLVASTFLHAAATHAGVEVPRPFGPPLSRAELDLLELEETE